MSASSLGKRIVLATFGSPGDLQPFLAIGSELRRRGHTAVIATSEIYRDQVTAAGLELAPIRPDRAPGQQDPDFFDRLLREHDRPRETFRAMFLPSLRDSVEDMLQVVPGADAVVAHTLVPGGRLAAEAHRVPWVSAVMQPMGYLSVHEPPVIGPPWIAAALRAAGIEATGRLFAVARALTGRWSDEWHAIRAELGLPAVREHPLWEGQHSLRRSLGLFPRVLSEPQADWPASARVTGFPFHHPPGRALDEALQRFLEAGAPPLVFTLGTTAVHDPGPFYDESAAAAQRLGLRAVLVVGPGMGDRFERWTDEIVAVPYAPHDLLFRRALAVVHQGGIGTLSEALRAAKPMLIMPYAHDQADNAWRASRLGVARIIARRRYRSRVVARALSAMIDETARRATFSIVARAIEREDGAATAADRILEAIA